MKYPARRGRTDCAAGGYRLVKGKDYIRVIRLMDAGHESGASGSSFASSFGNGKDSFAPLFARSSVLTRAAHNTRRAYDLASRRLFIWRR
jgi:hypothetical protein